MRRSSILIVLGGLVAFAAFVLVACGPDPDLPSNPSGSLYASDGARLAPAPDDLTPRNLILVLLDTVRRDVVSLGDEPDAAMPFLSQLGDQGIAFRQTTSPAPWTIPTVASVLTGLHPVEHGCRQYKDSLPAPKLSPAITTYAEVLKNGYGYQTAAFSDVPWHRTANGSLLQGFETGSNGQGVMLRARKPLESGFWLQGTSEILAPWVEALDRKRPFFLFLHTYDAHDPYGEANHPPASLEMVTDRVERRRRIDAVGSVTDLSDAELLMLALTSREGRQAMLQQRGPSASIRANKYAWSGYRANPEPEFADALQRKYVDGARFTDDGLQKLVVYLRQNGLLDDTLLVVFSDHGEAFGEHGMIGHGKQLDDELLHVPMVMTGPGPFATPQVVDESVGLIDIMPTFLDWIGVPDLEATRGRSLLPLMRGETEGRAILSEALAIPENTSGEARRVLESVRSDRWKYIVELDLNAGHISERLFDLSADPGERVNLLVKEPELSAFDITQDFCAQVELARDRVFEVAEQIDQRAFTPYSATAPTTRRARPAPACKVTPGAE